MTGSKAIVVDARAHLFGRLASVVAKQLLQGQRVVVVRCEELNVSGSLYRNHLKYAEWKRKRFSTNPTRGAFHYRAPSRMFFRAVRGMIPYKTVRGQAALEHLKVFDGVPPPFDKVKRMVVPAALRAMRLAPGREFTRLGDLSKMYGWNAHDVVARLEEKRKARSQAFHLRKKALVNIRAKALKTVSSNKDMQAKVIAPLAAVGY
ncbi:60S large subunit ribosomal protein uL13 (rpL13A) [Andalucia godoyi]|uniref:60S large subunit ribosomal protein uL13 (RpL13A) n=1 Tax=Andalucia godoyi TaxID=505711 RepID=A0A8K0F0F2_ANDGO|nr:60S large subunit ribosomal protein uL13 (rpL13A) [Andalucia godoyi]WCZ58610.1 60S ribosomal protein L16 [Andalucia godoyi]|eukprot:ANDGO_03516.mRNA.1 60S large subunit ribosomal protein uL13 (rpL13A)